jgi:LysM repeat protein
VSYQQYTVAAGDSVSKIATKFHLKQWELLLANPNLADNPALLKLGLVINIPQPGQLTPPPALIQTAPSPT